MDLSNESNTSIGCNVEECKYHTGDDYCSLEHIDVVKNENNSDTTTIEYTDCGSFESKDEE